MYRRNLLKKLFLLKNVIFRGLSLSQGHFGQQAPEGPVSQLQDEIKCSVNIAKDTTDPGVGCFNL